MKRLLLFVGFIFFIGANELFAQQEFTLHMMRTIPQSAYNNPAYVPKFNCYVGLPVVSSIYTSEYSSGFNYNDIFSKRAEDDSLILNLENLNNKLKKRNYLINEQEIDVLSFGFRINPKLYFNFNLTGKDVAMMEYPRDILALLVEGNSDYVGQTMDLKLNAHGVGYFETAAGLSYQVNDRLSVGGRLKYLSGVMNVQTNQAEFSLFTDEFYELTISGNIDVKTSGVEELFNDNYSLSFSDLGKYFKNSGVAIDLGATYELTEKLTIGASVSDIGFIKWKSNVAQYSMDSELSEFTWEGLDISKLIRDENELDDLLDSLGNSFEFTETLDGSYTTKLPLRAYFTSSYQLPYNAQLGMVLFGEKIDNRILGGLGVVANKRIGKYVDFSLSYSFRKDAYNNLGGGVSLNLPPFQIYAVSDNLLGAAMNINEAKYLNFRVGLNLVFDWQKFEVALPTSNSD